ncbi:hypothetical protein D9M72_629560 [compost metagenome]
MPSGKPAPVMAPVAPVSRSAISVMASSPSQGPTMASPPSSISSRSLAAACGTSILKYDTLPISRAMRARNGALSVVPLTGASWIMMGMSMASETVAKNS